MKASRILVLLMMGILAGAFFMYVARKVIAGKLQGAEVGTVHVVEFKTSPGRQE